MNFVKKSPYRIHYTITWLPVIVCMIIAAYARFWLNSNCNYLLVGGDGPYYPLQVRSMVESGRLALPDMPLWFILEALLAKLLVALNVSTLNGSVLLAVKWMDALLPPLAAIPVFFVAKEFYSPGIKARLLSYLVVAYAIINFTTTVVFSSALQKNAFAVFWMFLYLYLIIHFIRSGQRNYFWHALFVLFLCAFTHFGSFSLLIFFTVLLTFFWGLYNKEKLKGVDYRNVIIAIIGLILLVSAVAYFDPSRFSRLVHIPLKLFEYPLYLLMLSGFDITEFLSPIHMLSGNVMALYAWIIVLYNRKKLTGNDKAIVYALIAGAFFLSSPLLGLEWANRLQVMNYIPLVIVYLFIFNKIHSKWVKIFPALIFLLFTFMSLLNLRAHRGCITSEAYAEFRQIKEKLNFTSNSVITGRQDLRLLGSWECRTKASADYLLTKSDFKKYDTVYVIRQLEGNNFSPGRFRGDADVPVNSTKVYSGSCFELYKINSIDQWKGGMGKPSKAKGVIVSVDENRIVLKNEKTGRTRTVELSGNTNLHTTNLFLNPGMRIEVWGSWKPFSLNVVAEDIYETGKTIQ